MKQEKKRNIDEWIQIIKKQEASGLTVKEFCKAEGVGTWSFYQWRKRIRLKSDKNVIKTDNFEKNTFLELGKIPVPSRLNSGSESASGTWSVILTFGNELMMTVRRN